MAKNNQIEVKGIDIRFKKINQDEYISLTDIAKFPTLKLKDPYAKKGIAPWKAWLISLSSLVVVLAVLWVLNLFAWAGFKSPLPRYNTPEPVEEVVAEEIAETASADSTAVMQ